MLILGIVLTVLPLALGLTFLLFSPLDYVFWPKPLQVLFRPLTLVLGIASLTAGITLLVIHFIG